MQVQIDKLTQCIWEHNQDIAGRMAGKTNAAVRMRPLSTLTASSQPEGGHEREQVSPEQLDNMTRQALERPPPSQVIPILSDNTIQVKHNTVRPDYSKLFARSEQEFWAEYFGPVVARPVRRPRRPLEERRAVVPGRVREKDVKDHGLLQLINQGLIPQDFALDGALEGDLTVQPAGAPSPASAHSPGRRSPRYRLEGAEHAAEVEEAVQAFRKGLGADEIRQPPPGPPQDTARPKRRLHWTQLSGAEYRTAFAAQFVDDHRSRECGVLHYNVALDSIPVLHGQLVRNVQFKALLQHYSFMRHVVAALADRLDRAIGEAGIHAGDVQVKALVEIAYSVYFGEARPEVEELLALVQSPAAAQPLAECEPREATGGAEVRESPSSEDTLSVQRMQHYDIDSVATIQRFWTARRQRAQYRKKLAFELARANREHRAVCQGYYDAVDRAVLSWDSGGTAGPDVWDLIPQTQNVVVFMLEGIDYDLLGRIASVRAAVHVVLFEALDAHPAINQVVLDAGSALDYLNVVTQATASQASFVDEVYSFVFVALAHNVLSYIAALSGPVYCVPRPQQTQSRYFVRLLQKLRLAAPVVPQKLFSPMTYKALYQMRGNAYSVSDDATEPQKVVQLHEIKIQAGVSLQQSLLDAVPPENNVKQVRRMDVQAVGGQNLVSCGMGGQDVCYVLPGNTLLRIYQNSTLGGERGASLLLQTFPYQSVAFYGRVSFFLIRQHLTLNQEQIGRLATSLLGGALFQALECPSYVSFEKSMSYGELYPAACYQQLPACRREHVAGQFRELLVRLLSILAMHGLYGVQINIGLGFCVSGELFFNGVSFGHGLAQRASSGMWRVVFGAVTNINVISGAKTHQPTCHFYRALGRTHPDRVPRLYAAVEMPLPSLGRPVTIHGYYDIIIEQSSYKQLRERLATTVATLQAETGNEELAKRIVQARQATAVQDSQRLLEDSGTSCFATAVVNGMAQ